MKKNNAFTKWLSDIWAYIESYLNNWWKKTLFLLSILIAELISLYIIAVFDVGLREMTLSVSEMLTEYRKPYASYPWDLFLVFTLCILLMATLVIWKNGFRDNGRNFKFSKSDVYGSSREISKKELEQVSNVTDKDSTKETILGQLDDTGKRVIASKPGAMPNDNILVFGPPGSGKSYSFVRPYIVQSIMRRHSLIVSDTKGEVYATTAEYARYMGYRVLRLDLKDPAHSDGWAVLKELRHDDFRALIFAQIVMANSGNQRDNFAAPQESLLKACCLYQERHPGLADSQRTFYNAFALLLQSAENLDATITSAFANYGACMQVVSDSYSTFLQGSANLRGNIITGLANRLQVLASPPVREMTSTDEIDFASLGKEPTILYISMSDQHQTMSFLASLAFSFAFLDLVDLADSNPGQKLAVPVDFLMEEFGNLGRIPSIQNYLSTARSRGISINLVIQSLAQLTDVYEENVTSIILADCAKWICLACNDEDTAKLLEWRCGEATVKVKTEQHDALEPSFKLTHKNSTGDGRRNLFTSNEIMEIQAQKEALIIWQGKKVLLAKSFPISMHHDFIAGHMPEISSITLIPLANKKAKELFRKWEEDRIQSFNTWLANGGDPLADFNGLKAPGATSTIRPETIPLHTLERMALAAADGKEYDAKDDPDNPINTPKPKTQKRKPRKKEKAPKSQEPIIDISVLVFEKTPAEQHKASQKETPIVAVDKQAAPAQPQDTTPPPAPPQPETPPQAPVSSSQPQMQEKNEGLTEKTERTSADSVGATNYSYAKSKESPSMESYFGTNVSIPKKNKAEMKLNALEKAHNSLPPRKE